LGLADIGDRASDDLLKARDERSALDDRSDIERMLGVPPRHMSALARRKPEPPKTMSAKPIDRGDHYGLVTTRFG
jgi:hypothetical protein